MEETETIYVVMLIPIYIICFLFSQLLSCLKLLGVTFQDIYRPDVPTETCFCDLMEMPLNYMYLGWMQLVFWQPAFNSQYFPIILIAHTSLSPIKTSGKLIKNRHMMIIIWNFNNILGIDQLWKLNMQSYTDTLQDTVVYKSWQKPWYASQGSVEEMPICFCWKF